MRSKSAEMKRKIYDFVNDWRRDEGRSPSLKAIADHLKVSRTTVYRYLIEMNKQGDLVYDGKVIDTKELNSKNTRLSGAMIVGNIPCGEAVNVEPYVEEYVNLPVSLFGDGEFYILRAKGDSMEDAGIHEKDLIVIRQQPVAEIGDIVVALDDEDQNTLKRFGGFDKHHNAILEYMNEAVYPGKTIKVKHLVVQGVAKHVIKSL